MFCAPLLNLTLSFSIWEMDAITRHTTHEKSWVKWMFLNETYHSNTAIILMMHLGIESPKGWQFTAWNKIRRKKNKQNSQVLFCVSCGKVFGFEHLSSFTFNWPSVMAMFTWFLAVSLRAFVFCNTGVPYVNFMTKMNIARPCTCWWKSAGMVGVRDLGHTPGFPF